MYRYAHFVPLHNGTVSTSSCTVRAAFCCCSNLLWLSTYKYTVPENLAQKASRSLWLVNRVQSNMHVMYEPKQFITLKSSDWSSEGHNRGFQFKMTESRKWKPGCISDRRLSVKPVGVWSVFHVRNCMSTISKHELSYSRQAPLVTRAWGLSAARF